VHSLGSHPSLRSPSPAQVVHPQRIYAPPMLLQYPTHCSAQHSQPAQRRSMDPQDAVSVSSRDQPTGATTVPNHPANFRAEIP
jgi:hypothetical protein